MMMSYDPRLLERHDTEALNHMESGQGGDRTDRNIDADQFMRLRPKACS